MKRFSYITILGLILYSFEMVYGQTTFVKGYEEPGTMSSKVKSIAITADGGYVLAGRSNDFLGGWDNTIVIKTDANGDTIWTKVLGSNAPMTTSSCANSIKQTSDHGYIIGGYCATYVGGTLIDTSAVMLIRLDSVGNTQWIKRYGGVKKDLCNQVIQTADGGFAMVGYTKNSGAVNEDIYVLKVDGSGTILWSRIFGTVYRDYGTDIHETSDGGLIVSGYSTSYSLLSYLIKLDATGNTLWQNAYDATGAGGFTSFNSVKQTHDGGYIAVGGSKVASTVNKIYLIKTDSLGIQQWAKLLSNGTVYGYFGNDVTETADGHFIMNGSSMGGGTPYLGVYKFDSTGTLVLAKRYGNGYVESGIPSTDNFSEVLETADGGYICGGDIIQDQGFIKTDSLGVTTCYSFSALISAVAVTSTITPAVLTLSSGGTETPMTLDSVRGAHPVTQCIASNTVWPGDADHNSVADNFDLLPLGIHYGAMGAARAVTSNLWMSYPATNWGVTEANGHDIKNADCNGDGLINDDDTLAINLNFSQIHAMMPTDLRASGSPFYLSVPSTIFHPGDWVTVDIMAGTATSVIPALYGVAFNISYNSSLVQTSTESLTYPASWLGTPGFNALKISKISPVANMAYGAITRRNHTNSSGFGKIGELKFRLSSTISSSQLMPLNFSVVTANDSIGNPVTLNTVGDTVQISVSGSGINEDTSGPSFEIYPNPFNTETEIVFDAIQVNSRLEVIDLLGKVVREEKISKTNKVVLKKEALLPGMYFVSLIDDRGHKSTKKVVVK